jgi:O-acetylserine/cysteine efflux transporter
MRPRIATLLRVTRRDALLASLVSLIWGVNFVVIDWGMKGIPPLLFAAIRFTVVVIPAAFFVPRPQAPWKAVAGIGTFMCLGQFALLYTSLHLGLAPGIAALILQAQVLFTVLIAAAWLRELPTRNQMAGVLIGAAGLTVVGLGREGGVPVSALITCVAAALSWAIGNVASRRVGVKSGLSIAVWSAVVVPVPLFALSLIIDGPSTVGHALGHLGPKAIASTLYTAGLASLVGYSVFNGLLARYSASTVVPWILLVPPVAIIAAWLLQSDVPNRTEVLGGAVALAGVLLTVAPARRRALRAAALQRGTTG